MEEEAVEKLVEETAIQHGANLAAKEEQKSNAAKLNKEFKAMGVAGNGPSDKKQSAYSPSRGTGGSKAGAGGAKKNLSPPRAQKPLGSSNRRNSASKVKAPAKK